MVLTGVVILVVLGVLIELALLTGGVVPTRPVRSEAFAHRHL